MSLNDLFDVSEDDELAIKGPVDLFVKGARYLTFTENKKVLENPNLNGLHMNASLITTALTGVALAIGIYTYNSGIDNAQLANGILMGAFGGLGGMTVSYLSTMFHYQR